MVGLFFYNYFIKIFFDYLILMEVLFFENIFIDVILVVNFCYVNGKLKMMVIFEDNGDIFGRDSIIF